MTEACGGCRYWRELLDDLSTPATMPSGDCRRFPTGLRKLAHEWCGEFAAPLPFEHPATRGLPKRPQSEPASSRRV